MVKDELYIRRASAADAPLLSHISGITFFDTFHNTCTDDDIRGFIDEFFNADQVYKELMNEDDFYFIAFINENAVGYIRLKEEDNDVEVINKHKGIELKRIYVLKEHHSKKIGAALLKFAVDFAASKNYELLWLGVWEHNYKAKNFYKSFGFEDSGFKHPFPIGTTPQTDNWLIKFIERR